MSQVDFSPENGKSIFWTTHVYLNRSINPPVVLRSRKGPEEGQEEGSKERRKGGSAPKNVSKPDDLFSELKAIVATSEVR